MVNKVSFVRLDYGREIYGVNYDDGRSGGYVELAPGEVPTYENVLRAILGNEWPEARQHALLLALQFAPDDVDTIKERNARAFTYSIAVDAAKTAMAAFAASTAMSKSKE